MKVNIDERMNADNSIRWHDIKISHSKRSQWFSINTINMYNFVTVIIDTLRKRYDILACIIYKWNQGNSRKIAHENNLNLELHIINLWNNVTVAKLLSSKSRKSCEGDAYHWCFYRKYVVLSLNHKQPVQITFRLRILSIRIKNKESELRFSMSFDRS